MNSKHVIGSSLISIPVSMGANIDNSELMLLLEVQTIILLGTDPLDNTAVRRGSFGVHSSKNN